MKTPWMAAVILASAALTGCAGMSTAPAKAKPRALLATALLEPTKGNQANGSARFIEEGDDVLVQVAVHNLPPNSVHGFHLHEKGDCSSGDGMSAGGHFNPDAAPHGAPSAPHHAGDMPALKADANGIAQTSFVLHGLTVSAGAHSVVGKGLIVHKDPDDYTTQPTGNSGARIACGVVMLR